MRARLQSGDNPSENMCTVIHADVGVVHADVGVVHADVGEDGMRVKPQRILAH